MFFGEALGGAMFNSSHVPAVSFPILFDDQASPK